MVEAQLVQALDDKVKRLVAPAHVHRPFEAGAPHLVLPFGAEHGRFGGRSRHDGPRAPLLASDLGEIAGIGLNLPEVGWRDDQAIEASITHELLDTGEAAVMLGHREGREHALATGVRGEAIYFCTGHCCSLLTLP